MEIKNDIINVVLDELIKRGLIKKNVNTYESTKDLLRNFNRIEKSIKHIDKQIKDLNSKANTLGNPKIPTAMQFEKEFDNSLTSIDQIEQRINTLKQTQVKIKVFIEFVKHIIESELSQKEQELLKSFYFDKKDVNELCVDYSCEQSTIYRNLNKSINSIKIEIFAEKYIEELYN